MSATLGALLHQLEPSWSITILERLGDVALESSSPWNNAGTGHSALCELNYTPEKSDGTIDISQAVKVNEQFQVTRQFWSFLVSEGMLPEPERFINPVPHMSFVWGQENVEYLRRRFDALKDHPLFQGMEFSDDAAVIRGWAPMLIPGRRKDQPIAATRIMAGSDVDFGSLTRLLLDGLVESGATLRLENRVTSLRKKRDGLWHLGIRHDVGGTPLELTARFVFVGRAARRCNCFRSRASTRSAATAGSRSAASSCAPMTPRSSPSTRPRSTARPRWAPRRCRFPTSIPGWSTASRACCSAPMPASAPGS
jgi:Predicted dehydrogenase